MSDQFIAVNVNVVCIAVSVNVVCNAVDVNVVALLSLSMLCVLLLMSMMCVLLFVSMLCVLLLMSMMCVLLLVSMFCALLSVSMMLCVAVTDHSVSNFAYARAKIPSLHCNTFCITVGIFDVVTLSDFGKHQFMRFRMAWVKFQAFPLTFDVVLTTCWHYRQ